MMRKGGKKGGRGGIEGEGEAFRKVIVIVHRTTMYSLHHMHVLVCYCSRQNIIVLIYTLNTYTHTYTHSQPQYIHTFIHTYIHTYMHTFVHIRHTYIDIHTYP